jgi:hypothetical protein
MLPEKVPSELSFAPVSVRDSSGKEGLGRVAYKEWESKEAFWRGFKKSAKIVGILIALPLPFLFLEPFAFMVWGSAVIFGSLLFIGPYLHMKYWGEAFSFFYVEAECPYCRKSGKLNPYVSTELQEEFTVLCSACGQTSIARLREKLKTTRHLRGNPDSADE